MLCGSVEALARSQEVLGHCVGVWLVRNTQSGGPWRALTLGVLRVVGLWAAEQRLQRDECRLECEDLDVRAVDLACDIDSTHW